MSEGSASLSLALPLLVRQRGVMVVDDCLVHRHAAALQLRNLGINLRYEAGDGQEALTMLAELSPQPAVMLLDLELPGLDGIEVLQQLQSWPDRPEIILVSSSDEVLLSAVATMAEAMGIHLLGAFRKPLRLESLARALAAAGQESRGALVNKTPQPEAALLRLALARGDIKPFYQPKLNLQQPDLAGFEVLARWRDTEGLEYSPSQFIPLAEQENLIGQLTLELLDQSLIDMARWRDAGIDTSIAFNLSAHCLSQPSCANQIIQRVLDARLDPRLISFEITETALVMDLPSALATISRLRLRGFGLSIDDYGTGFSSLQQLARFPFTELKIDRSFVHGAIAQGHVWEILKSAIDMSRRLGITSVAEGVETREQLDLLRALGCRQAQGYFIARPMAGSDVARWIAEELPNRLALCNNGNTSIPPQIASF